jgi:putative oxidoreductase
MFMKSFETYAYALLRIVAGFMFLWHGSQKLLNVPAASHPIPPSLKFVAGPIELIGGFLIMIGLGTRWAAFIASGEMAVAYWYASGTKAFLPLVNHGDLTALYCFVFLFISAAGYGKWGIDGFLARHREP